MANFSELANKQYNNCLEPLRKAIAVSHRKELSSEQPLYVSSPLPKNELHDMEGHFVRYNQVTAKIEVSDDEIPAQPPRKPTGNIQQEYRTFIEKTAVFANACWIAMEIFPDFSIEQNNDALMRIVEDSTEGRISFFDAFQKHLGLAVQKSDRFFTKINKIWKKVKLFG